MQREARYGQHTYEVKVSTDVSQTNLLYVEADSVTVSGGALMFASEMDPLEAFDDDAEVRPGQVIEMSPVVVIAPGQWYSIKLVDHELRPMFAVEGQGR
jgi:hypothetical protein